MLINDQTISPEMREYLQRLRKKVYIGTVGGSNFEKQVSQIGKDGFEVIP